MYTEMVKSVFAQGLINFSLVMTFTSILSLLVFIHKKIG